MAKRKRQRTPAPEEINRREHDAEREQVVAARLRQFPWMTRAQAKTTESADPLGRLTFATHPLGYGKAPITSGEHQAGREYEELRLRYLSLKGLPRQGVRSGGGGGPCVHDDKIRRTTLAYAEANKALMARGTATQEDTWAVCIDGQEPRSVPVLRIGLRALAGHFNIPVDNAPKILKTADMATGEVCPDRKAARPA